jgi:uncharacterized membrane protein YraQ (UPF0718 family)
MKRSSIVKLAGLVAYVVFIIISLWLAYSPGEEIARNFASFSLDMLKIIPGAFILIGLFDVWVKKETVEKHLGEGSGFRGYVWVILLAGATVGGLYVAFPVAYSMYSKGARLSVIFTYVGAAAVCRIPMTIFEASFLGISFSIIRLAVSLILVIISAMLFGNYLKKRNYKISDGTR